MIEIRNVVKSYEGGKRVLDEFSLTVKEGELVVIKGKSGSGKSTLLWLIAALMMPDSGEIILNNKSISKLPDHFASAFRRENIGIIFQKYNLLEDLTVAQNVALPLLPSALSSKELDAKATLAMKAFHIEHKAHELVRKLSGGEQQRCAIARANVNAPSIILADEPTANLDEKLSLAFIEMLREMKQEKKCIIVATHDPLFFSLDFVDRVVDFDS